MAAVKKKIEGKTLILLYDGACWHGGIPHSDGTWERMREEVPKLGNLPESPLHWGLEGGALHVRVAVPAELFDMEGEPGSDLTLLSPAELYETLCYELSDPSGMEPDEIVPAVAGGRALKLGSEEERLVGAALRRDAVTAMNELCEHHGLRFDGITSLQGLLLATHSRERASAREGLLFLGSRESFVCGVANGEHHHTVRTVPGSCPSAGELAEAARRLERRIKPLLNNPLHLIVPADTDCAVETWVNGLAQDAVRCSTLYDLCPAMMQLLADAPSHMLEGPVGMAGLPPKVRDDKFTGGIICGSAILLTVLVLGAMWGGKEWQKHSIEKLKGQVAALERTQKSAAAEFESVESELNRTKRLYASLNAAPPIMSRHFTDIIVALSTTLPKYSRITSVIQESNCTRITGATLWPQEVSGFLIALQGALSESNLRVIPMTMTPTKGSDETFFEMEIRQ